MRLIAALAVVSVVCLSAAPASAGEWSLDKWVKRESPWKGHGIGSSVTETTTVPMPKMPPNMPDVPGMPKDGKMVTTNKTTLTKITKDGYVLTIATTSMGRTTTRTETEPKVRVLKGKLSDHVKDAGEEALTIGGKSYTCKVKTVANMDVLMGDSLAKAPPGRAGKPTLQKGKIWEHPTHGVLKMETTMNVMGQTATMTWLVKRLTANFVLGKNTYPGREVKVTTSHAMGTSNMTMLTSNTVPGGTLKNVVESAMMGRKMTITTVLTAYTKKPLTATTPAAK